MTRQPHPQPERRRSLAAEFSRFVDTTRLGRHAHHMPISANQAERAALAKRFDLVALDRLDADLMIKKRGDGIVELSGRFRARLAQSCVVTLEPVWTDIDEPVECYFGEQADDEGSAPSDPLDDQAFPEPLTSGGIDCGEAVAQALALSLDPYPRAPAAGKTGQGSF